jgi:catechol 2,3-dioxygenase-like lactoylglutathione lyase family enzyme
MIHAIDHIVIAVHDLETAIADYSALGFTVVRGGRHSGLNTHNALIAFADGCYLELIAFLGSPPAVAHWWYKALQRGGGLTDFCVQSNDLKDDAAAFTRAGATISTPFAMGRERPDGYRINWELAVNEGGTRGLVPFFIRDITSRDERVPRSLAHQNGAAGVASFAIAAADVDSIRMIYQQALGQRGEPVNRDDLQAAGVRFALGPHELQLIAASNSSGVTAERLRIRGPSPVEVRLSATIHGLLDIRQAHGARIVLG